MSQKQNARTVRFKPAAITDLERVWEYTADRWSPDQADSYLTDLHDAIERLAENPAIARERTEYTPPVRIHRIRSHIVICRDEGDCLLVIRVRHGSEDWASDPANE